MSGKRRKLRIAFWTLVAVVADLGFIRLAPMPIALWAIIGTLIAVPVGFGAFCIWLLVRIINRGPRWAKWTAPTIAASPMLYLLSYGPAVWLVTHEKLSDEIRGSVGLFYYPVQLLIQYGPDVISEPLYWYLGLWVDANGP